MLLSIVALVFALSLAGCGLVSHPADGTVIDGWLVGPPATCEDRVIRTEDNVEVDRGRCVDLVAAAAKALDDRDPGHPAVAAMELHDRRWPPNTCCGLQYVAVYTLVDGSVKAIGVGWPGVATYPYTIPFGP